MPDHYSNAKKDMLFTLYFKENNVTINLFKPELISLIKEAIELLEISGEKHDLFENENAYKIPQINII